MMIGLIAAIVAALGFGDQTRPGWGSPRADAEAGQNSPLATAMSPHADADRQRGILSEGGRSFGRRSALVLPRLQHAVRFRRYRV
ncbi:hypothetical protein [Gordonia hydrophobica]|uniref:Uncharacterized protein n=1 Tax=Gordonia hydrophobica TaxID=40516 RepID=A0ABZ2U767_9ACTN|nr:hypothetical protein [Gordonia hydrophobica]MBM7368177.1 hypothetical protein [Gordonia hydrophobica]